MAVGQVVYLLGPLKDNHGGYFFRAKFDPYHGSAGLRNWGLITFRQDVMLAIQKNIQVVIGANLLGVARDI